MTENLNHAAFGGLIFLSDFNTTIPRKNNLNEGSEIARRIEQDRKFDPYCRDTSIFNSKRNYIREV